MGFFPLLHEETNAGDGFNAIHFLLFCFNLLNFTFAGIPENYEAFIDKIDGYSYYYPSDWRVSSNDN